MLDPISFYILAFLGVFVETLPFLMLGALVSGLAAAFLSREDLAGLLPRRRLLGVLVGALLGLFFPVGAAGAAPLARRFYRNGFSLPVVVAFWLAAPALNPISLTVMLALLGPGPLLWGRMALGYAFAAAVGMAVWAAARPSPGGRGGMPALLHSQKHGECSNSLTPLKRGGVRGQLQQALLLAADDLFDFAPYLLVGSLLAALPRAFLPQQALHGQLLPAVLAGNSLAQVFLVQGLMGSLSTLLLVVVLSVGPALGIQNLALLAGVFTTRLSPQPSPKERGEPGSLAFQERAGAGAYRSFQTPILVVLGIFILWQAWSGEMRAYVDQRMAPLVILAGLGCLVLAEGVRNFRKPAGEGAQKAAPADLLSGRRGNLLALALPVLVGLVLIAYGGQERLRAPVLTSEEIGGRGPLTLAFAQAMTPASVEQRFHLQPDVHGRFTWEGNRLHFWPQEPLTPGQTYTVTLDPGSTAMDGRAIFSPEEWTVRVRKPWVVYLSPMNEGPELWRVRADGGGGQPLTDTGGRVQDFGVSPDGEWIAYAVKNDQGGADLWQVDRAGESSNLLDCGTDICTQPSIAPEGTRIVYVRGSAATRGVQPVSEIRLFDRSTGMDAPLISNTHSTGDKPSWSPDGQRLAYYDISSGGLRVVNMVDGTDIFLPSTSESAVSWSPDGTKMLYTDTQTALGEVFVLVYEANFETGVNQPALKDNPDVAEYGTPDWSPDGEWLATSVRLVGNLVNRQIWMMQLDGSQARPVTSDFTYSHNSYHWSPSGQELLFQRFSLNSSDARPEVVVWQRETEMLTVLAEDAGFPKWEP